MEQQDFSNERLSSLLDSTELISLRLERDSRRFGADIFLKGEEEI